MGSYSCRCSTILTGQRKAIQKLVSGAFWRLRQCRRGGTEIPTNPKDNDAAVSHSRWLTCLSVTFHNQCSQRKGGRNYDFQGAYENEKILITTILAGTHFVFTIEFAKVYDTENLVLKKKTKTTSTPSRVDVKSLKTADIATSSRRFVDETHFESRDADSQTEHAQFARNVEIGQVFVTNESAVDGKQFKPFYAENTRAKELSKFQITISSERSCQDRTGDWN